MILAAVTALAWLAAQIFITPDEAVLHFGFIPARLSGVEAPFAVVPAFLTPLTSTLVHANFLHLAFNLLIFLWCGAAVERMLGAPSMVLIYILGAYGAAIAQWAVEPMSFDPTIGASGAISAVIGAFALSFGRPRTIVASPRLNRIINSLWLLAAWVGLQIAIGWMARSEGLMFATAAHIGGFLVGLVLQRPLMLYRYRSA